MVRVPSHQWSKFESRWGLHFYYITNKKRPGLNETWSLYYAQNGLRNALCLFYQNFIKMFHEANPLKPYIWMLPPMEIKQWKGVIFMNWKLPRFCKKIFYVGRPHLGIKANISKWAWVKILTGLNHKYKCCKFIFQYLHAMTLFKRPNKTELSNPNWWELL